MMIAAQTNVETAHQCLDERGRPRMSSLDRRHGVAHTMLDELVARDSALEATPCHVISMRRRDLGCSQSRRSRSRLLNWSG